MKKLKKHTVKLYLTLDRPFYDLLKGKSANDYMKTATWVKQYLMRNLNKTIINEPINKSENDK